MIVYLIVNKRRVPHASVLRVGSLYPSRGNRSGQRTKTGNNEIKSLTRKTDAWGAQFILSLDIRATRPNQFSICFGPNWSP